MAVRSTQPLREAFGAQARHFVDVQPIYPDAGIRLEQLMLRLFDHIIPMLESQPDLGRPMTLAPPTSSLEAETDEEFALLAGVLPGLAQAPTTLREYVDKQFNILYAVTPDAVYLIDLKHHKQRAYRSR